MLNRLGHDFLKAIGFVQRRKEPGFEQQVLSLLKALQANLDAGDGEQLLPTVINEERQAFRGDVHGWFHPRIGVAAALR